jgi:hypothetical protein
LVFVFFFFFSGVLVKACKFDSRLDTTDPLLVFLYRSPSIDESGAILESLVSETLLPPPTPDMALEALNPVHLDYEFQHVFEAFKRLNPDSVNLQVVAQLLHALIQEGQLGNALWLALHEAPHAHLTHNGKDPLHTLVQSRVFVDQALSEDLLAIEAICTKLIRALKQLHGADPNRKDEDGGSAFEYASARLQSELAKTVFFRSLSNAGYDLDPGARKLSVQDVPVRGHSTASDIP